MVAADSPGLAKGSAEGHALGRRTAAKRLRRQGTAALHREQNPGRLAGLLIAALFAAAMSSIDTSLNSSATIALQDFYRRWVRPDADEAQSLRFLRVMTVVWGGIGTGVALAMMGVESILDAWWKLSGVFAGGMLGLFLLGFISRRANNAGAVTGATVGLLVILWLTFSTGLTGDLAVAAEPVPRAHDIGHRHAVDLPHRPGGLAGFWPQERLNSPPALAPSRLVSFESWLIFQTKYESTPLSSTK